MAGGPDRPRGAPEAIFQHFPKWGPIMEFKMGSKNGVQNGVQNGLRKSGPNFDGKCGFQNRATSVTYPQKCSAHALDSIPLGFIQIHFIKIDTLPSFAKMVAPRQYCFNTLDGLGPRSAQGPSGGHFSACSKMGTKSGFQKKGSKNGV